MQIIYIFTGFWDLRKFCLIVLFTIFAFCRTFSAAAEEEKNFIEKIRYGETSKGTRIVFDLSRKADYRIFSLDKPYRIVVDMPNMNWHHPKSGFIDDNNLIKSYRSGELESGMTRVIFDLRNTAIIEKAFFLEKTSSQGNRLVIDLEKASANLFEARKTQVFGNKDLKALINKKKIPAAAEDAKLQSSYSRNNQKEIAALKVPTSEPVSTPKRKPQYSAPRNPNSKKFVVVLDAGHGGEDPGALQNGAKEKDITLAFAQNLKRQMEETGKFKVIMTRDRDVYIKLRDRLELSRKVNADLFVSVHADSIQRNDVSGASIYTLSEKASDTETARLAEDENNSGFVAGVDLGQESQEVADILLDLAMREKMNESNMFARMLREAFNRNDVRVLPNAHRSAGFAVLKAPDVPSVLIEIGFISNPKEARLLQSAGFQKNTAQAILDGVNTYFTKIRSLQKL